MHTKPTDYDTLGYAKNANPISDMALNHLTLKLNRRADTVVSKDSQRGNHFLNEIHVYDDILLG